MNLVATLFAVLCLTGLSQHKADPTDGFTQLPLTILNFEVQKPYDVLVTQRYSYINGVHRFWVYSTDKPFQYGSTTLPRTEIRIRGYDYSSGVWQFEGQVYVPQGTSGVSVMQVFGADPPYSITMQLRVYDGSLTYIKTPVLVSNMYGQWLKVNVIHDVNAGNVKVSSTMFSNTSIQIMEEALTTSNSAFMPRWANRITWSLVGRGSKF